MSDDLTPEQRAAVETLDADVCVTAGAGSGKTRVLVERFLRLALGEATGDRRQTIGGQAVRRSGVQEDEPSGPGSNPERLTARTPDRLSPVASPLSPAVDEILAITFTRKAALEMKERIAHALAARGRVEERRRLEVGFISTIHTFCERVLRENPFEAGLDPDFAVLDEPEAAILLERAYEQVLEEAFAREEDPVAELVLACYDRRGQDGADGVQLLYEDALRHLRALSSQGWSPNDVAAWAQEPPERFLERALTPLAGALDEVLTAFRAGAAALADLSLGGAMEERRAQVVAGCASLQALGPPAQPRVRTACRPCPGGTAEGSPGIHAWEAEPAMASPGGTAEYAPLPAKMSNHPRSSGDSHDLIPCLAEVETRLRLLKEIKGSLSAARRTKDTDPAVYDAAREQFDRMKAAYAGIEKWAVSWSPETERRSQELARAGLALLARLWERYERLKRERAALDFSDLQRLTRDLLRDSPAVRARLRARLRYLMVDEFQDTDPLQAEILDLLRSGRNLFFVGDARQSIYRFRNADVTLFIERERAVRAAEARDPAAARRLALATNFRSRPEILQFVNALFAHLWENTELAPPPAQGRVPAERADREGGSTLPYEPLEPGRAFDEKPAPSVELLLVEAEGGAEAVRRAEAAQVARRVRELLDGGATITRRDHPHRGEPVRARDVVLLFRSMTDAWIYEQALAAAGLPTFVVGGRQYYARREIRDVVNLLKTIGRPLDDLAVAATLRSPFVGISLDTLSLLRIQSGLVPGEGSLSDPPAERAPGGSLSGAIAPALDAQPIVPEDAARLRAFTALIERLRDQEDRFPVGQILEIALAETEYALAVLRRPGGRRSLANLRKLVQMAHAGPAGGAPEFVERIEALTRVGEREGDAPTHAEADDVVRLMSIHQAKGLEFPVVVLPDLGRAPRAPDLPLLALGPDRRLAACRAGEGSDTSPLHHTLAAAESAAAREESLRLLYVALTRAEEHLILAGPQPARSGTWAQLIWQLTGDRRSGVQAFRRKFPGVQTRTPERPNA